MFVSQTRVHKYVDSHLPLGGIIRAEPIFIYLFFY